MRSPVVLSFFCFILIGVTGCSDGFHTSTPSSSSDSNAGQGGTGETPTTPPTPPAEGPDLSICSDLAFDHVRWATRFDSSDRNAFALSLNITGSYEGNSGWANLTNNFDGQGLSMGLLNQTLGTGSLQPLLYKFRQLYPQSYESVMSGTQQKAMGQMLDAWAAAKGLNAVSVLSLKALRPVHFFERGFVGSDADANRDKFYASESVGAGDLHVMGAAESASVKWALQNLYADNGKTFTSAWRSALKTLAAHPDYISLQIEAAEYLHDRALAYQARAGFTQLRGYLMLFDVAVQNGSITSAQFKKFDTWAAAHAAATEEQAMLQLIDIRAAASKPQYQDDVRRRKRTIVLGQGTVHGANRNLPAEYCYLPQVSYPLALPHPAFL